MGFPELIRTLESYGVSDVLLPFILIFTIVFAVMQKSKLLGDNKKNFNIIIALVMSLAVVIPHVLGKYPRNADVVDIMNRALPNISIIIVAILMVLLIMGVFGANIKLAGTYMGGWMLVIGFLLVLIIFGNAAGWSIFQWDILSRMDKDIKNLIIIILVFGIIIGFITGDDKSEKTALSGMWDKIKEVVK